MQGFLKFAAIVFLGWLLIRWLERNVLGYGVLPTDANNGTVGGWPYAAPLNRSGSVVGAWIPPRGRDWATYFGLDFGGNQGPDIQFGLNSNRISAGNGSVRLY